MAGGGQSGSEADCFEFNLAAGQFARIVVDQQRIDVGLELFGPDRNDPSVQVSLSRVDRPNLNRGPEAISVVAELEGVYLLQVFPQLSIINQDGRYEVRLAGVRETRQPEDGMRMLAERAVTEGEERRYLGTACERVAAVKLFRQARDLWLELGDAYKAAIASYGLGLNYGSLGRYQSQIGALNKSLSLLEGLGREYGDAAAYLGAAVRTAQAAAYLSLGDAQNTYARNLEALPIRQSLEDDFGKAVTLTGARPDRDGKLRIRQNLFQRSPIAAAAAEIRGRPGHHAGGDGQDGIPAGQFR